MLPVARRPLSRPLRRAVRRAWQMMRPWTAVLAAAVLLSAGPVAAGELVGARFAEPTTRYAHGVLGDDVEWGALVLRLDTCPACARVVAQEVTIRLPETRVFEDLEPRLFTLPDGRTLVVVVESDARQGARLSVYGPEGLFAAGPFIGRSNRWLAPIGIGDLDGDGKIEIAYVDRPHLAKTLRVFRLDPAGTLTEVAQRPGFSNHRIGWDFIPGGLRVCADGPELIVASGDWRQVMAVRFDGTTLSARALGRYDGPDSLNAALSCPS
ncbi:VCBS repeat-containing protein [Aliiroseovarius sp.]|uniref:VCBS repeat-containing protein n=1 Tax=Aliiroseovarius sp. TaxID=1872442 RepID=UPI003BACA18F